MKKVLLTIQLLIILVLIFCIAGCGEDRIGPPTDEVEKLVGLSTQKTGYASGVELTLEDLEVDNAIEIFGTDIYLLTTTCEVTAKRGNDEAETTVTFYNAFALRDNQWQLLSIFDSEQEAIKKLTPTVFTGEIEQYTDAGMTWFNLVLAGGEKIFLGGNYEMSEANIDPHDEKRVGPLSIRGELLQEDGGLSIKPGTLRPAN